MLVGLMFYFAHKEEATVAPRAGDGVKMGHAVGGVEDDQSGISVDERIRDEAGKWEMELERSTLLIYISDTLLHRGTRTESEGGRHVLLCLL